jgi:uncharacterized protein (TIGR03435 family)
MKKENRTTLRAIRLISLLALAAAASSQTPPAHALRFEVASVKPSPPLDPQTIRSGQFLPYMRVDQARVDISRMALSAIICAAFKVKDYQVAGPGWQDLGPTGGPLFDVHATLPDGATEKDVPEMLQALLVERFGLKFHRDTSQQSTYAMVVGKNGPKMKESPKESPPEAPAGEAGSSSADKPPEMKIDANGGGTVRGGPSGNMKMRMQDGIMHMEMERVSMDRLAGMLSRLVDRPVVNMTDLKGDFQVTLDIANSIATDAARRMGRPDDTGHADGEAPDPGGSTIFQTMQNLGLKLDARKSDIERLIIDHVQKAPSEN